MPRDPSDDRSTLIKSNDLVPSAYKSLPEQASADQDLWGDMKSLDQNDLSMWFKVILK